MQQSLFWEVLFIDIRHERIVRAYIACIFEILVLILSINAAPSYKTPVAKETAYRENSAEKTDIKTAVINRAAESKRIINANSLPAPRKSSKAVTTIHNLTQREKELAAATALSQSADVQTEEKQQPETYYDTLTPEEISLIEVTIQHEVGGLSATYKRLIAELIYNRLRSDIYPDTVKEMLYQENQFIGIESWYYPDYPVDDETKAVVKEVFSKDTTTHQALAYYNPALSCEEAIIWFEYSGDVQFLFDYSEESWGIVYTTRFFK